MQHPQFLLVFTLALALLSCSGSVGTSSHLRSFPTESPAYRGNAPAVQTTDSAFLAAVVDAEKAEPSEVSRTLTRIHGNPHLVDTMIGGKWHLLVVCWDSRPDMFPDQGDFETDHSVWVTLAPQLRDRCRTYQTLFERTEATTSRLEQLLGMAPDGPERHFLELWVQPDNLFRPCPDSETDDTRCELQFPPNTTSDHREWFTDLLEAGFPPASDARHNGAEQKIWTRLGYTYDWNPENSSHIGLSEFVIHRDVHVWVRRKVSTEEFCDPDAE